MNRGDVVKGRCHLCAKVRLCRVDLASRYCLTYPSPSSLLLVCLSECSTYKGGETKDSSG